MSRMNYNIETIVLSNGLTIIYCCTPETIAFELSIHINTGSRDESENNNGVSHFLEHMLFRGSQQYPNSVTLAKNMEKFGGEANAMTTIEHTTYWLKGHSEKIVEAIEVFSEFFLNPNYADLEIERKVILQEAASDYNEEETCIDTESLGMECLFPNSGLGLPIVGRFESIKNISILNLKDKHRMFYFPKNCVLTIQTCTPKDKLTAAFEEKFLNQWNLQMRQDLPKEMYWRNDLISSYERQNQKKPIHYLSLQSNADNQFHLKLIFPISGNLNENTARYTFLQRLLDDGICTRLCASVREKSGLAYEISCDTQFFQDVGTFSVDATVSSDLLENLMEVLFKELNLIFRFKFNDEEIEHIRYRYLFDLYQAQETPSRLLHRAVVEKFMKSHFSLEDEIEIVKNITKDNIFELSQKMLKTPSVGFVLVGPKARKKRDLIEKFLENLFKEKNMRSYSI